MASIYVMGQKSESLRVKDLDDILKKQREGDTVGLPANLIEKAECLVKSLTQKHPIVVVEAPFELFS